MTCHLKSLVASEARDKMQSKHGAGSPKAAWIDAHNGGHRTVESTSTEYIRGALQG